MGLIVKFSIVAKLSTKLWNLQIIPLKKFPSFWVGESVEVPGDAGKAPHPFPIPCPNVSLPCGYS